MKRFANVGSDNYISGTKILSISSPNSQAIKKIVRSAKERGMCIDFTSGKKTESVIFTIAGVIILSSFSPKTLVKRFNDLDESVEEILEEIESNFIKK